jgi:hypothetical protein
VIDAATGELRAGVFQFTAAAAIGVQFLLSGADREGNIAAGAQADTR